MSEELLTVREALIFLECANRPDAERWLRRRIRRREAELKIKILVRDGRGYKARKSVLRMAFADRLDLKDWVAKPVKDKASKMLALQRATNERLDELTANVETLARCYRELTRRAELRAR